MLMSHGAWRHAPPSPSWWAGQMLWNCNCIVPIRPCRVITQQHMTLLWSGAQTRPDSDPQETTWHAYQSADFTWLLLHFTLRDSNKLYERHFSSTCDGGSQLPWLSKKTPRNKKNYKKRTTTSHACNQSQLAGRSIETQNLGVCSRKPAHGLYNALRVNQRTREKEGPGTCKKQSVSREDRESFSAEETIMENGAEWERTRCGKKSNRDTEDGKKICVCLEVCVCAARSRVCVCTVVSTARNSFTKTLEDTHKKDLI